MDRREPTVENQKQDDRITALEDGQKAILEMLKPISETYTTVSTLGKWGMAFMVFVSILIGIILSFQKLFK